MSRRINLYNALNELLDKKREQNRRYSLRAFARDLDLSPSFVSRALRGEKTFSPQQLKNIFRVLDVDRETQSKFKSLLVIEKLGKDYRNLDIKNLSKTHLTFKKVSKSKLGILAKWYYIPVLELVTASKYDISLKQIAKRLKITEQMAQESLDALQKLKILEKEEAGYVRKDEFIRMSSASSKPEIRNYHSSMIAKASDELKKIDDQSFSLRLITGLTISANPEKLEAAKAILNDAIHKASKILNDEYALEVYQINLQLFPLTNKE